MRAEQLEEFRAALPPAEFKSLTPNGKRSWAGALLLTAASSASIRGLASKLEISDGERQRRSDRARALVAEGRFGGREIGRQGVIQRHERDRQRASAIAQQLLIDHRDKVERAFLAGLEDRSPLTRLRAAEGLVKLALGAERIGVVEQRHEEQALDRAQLLAILSAKLSQGPTAAVVRRHLREPISDGEASA